jgi:quinoprotein glucose dehydrogenase
MLAPVIVIGAYAFLLLLVGLTLAVGGGYLLWLGGSPYYLLSGIAVTASGALLARRRAEGATLYALFLFVTVAWSLWEAGYNGWALMSRLLSPAILGLVLLIPAVRRRLIGHRIPWSFMRICGAFALACGLGALLRELVPPLIPPDPIYEAGMTASSEEFVPRSTEADSDWLHYGNDAGGTRFSSLGQITSANVTQLKLAWTFRLASEGGSFEATPLKVGQFLYFCTGANDIIALDAESGSEVWRFKSQIDTAKVPWPVCRGVAYFHVPTANGPCAERIFTATVDARLIAVDAQDGKPCATFGTNGQVSLLTGISKAAPGYYYVTSPPAVIHGKVIVDSTSMDNQYWGEPSGVIRAYDAVTGKLAWAWDMGRPDRTGEPAEGETYTPSTPNAWPPMSADETLGLVYIPLGNPTPDYFGAQRRSFDEQYNDALVALDADTGRPRWSFQTAYHDLWDHDIPAQPTLADIPSADGTVRAIIQPTKRGELFVLNRATGAPIFPVEEHPVPQRGTVPEERLSPTQPYSVGLPSFRGAVLVEHDMWGITPLDQLWCRVRFRKTRYDGPATPPGLTPSLEMPGSGGGSEWGGASVDTSRHIAIINSNIWPTDVQLIPRAEADRLGLKPFSAEDTPKSFGVKQPQFGTPYAAHIGFFMSPLGVPCKQPPYGRLSALDLRTGKLIWTRIFGTARDLGPLGLRSRLPFTIGTFNDSGSVATRSGVFFIGAAEDRRLRAYETATGKLLWEVSLPGGGDATPMTYMSRSSGRQFVVIAASGTDGVHVGRYDYVMAYALPNPMRQELKMRGK